MADEKLQPILYRDFSGGMASNINPTLAPPNVMSLILNMDADNEIGSLVSRLGTGIVGSQLVDNNPLLGLWQHIDTDTAASNKLFATINVSANTSSVIYNVETSSTVQTGLTASKKMRFLTLLGSTLALNGADAERAWDGSSWITTGGVFDLANIPSSNKVSLALEFLDRVYVAGDTAHPSRLYYSSIHDGSAVSWSAGNGYVDIEAEDAGGAITALAKVPGYVLVFKERSMHRWSFLNAFPESLVNIGAASQESVVQGGGLVAFYSNSNENDKGFYITNGGRPVSISHNTPRPIKKWIDAIPTANEANIAGFATDSVFAWSVGDLTVDGVSYTNVVLRYNRVLNQWSVRSYPSEFKVFANYLVSGVNTIVGGDDDGCIIRVDKTGTYSDYPSSTPIHWAVQTLASTFGTNRTKSITNCAVARVLKGLVAPISFVVDGVTTPFPGTSRPISTSSIGAMLWHFIFGGASLTGTEIAVRIEGDTVGAQAVLREIEIPSITANQSYA